MLLRPEFRARLERLALRSSGRVTALWAGRHTSTRKGESLDFADYRQYVPGDDFRRIDHNLRARLGQLLIRQYEAEDERPLRVIVDISASMGLHGKFETAQAIAASVIYLGLAGGDRVMPAAVPGADGRAVLFGPTGRHLSSWPRLEGWLESRHAGGATPLASGLRAAMGGEAGRGAVVLVSDLLDPEWERALDGLAVGAGGLVVQVLATPELQPDLTGDLRLTDVETGATVDVGTSEEAMDSYRQALERFVSGAAGRARRAGLDYVLVEAGPMAHEEVVDTLLRTGVVR